MSSGVSAAIEDWGFCEAKAKNAGCSVMMITASRKAMSNHVGLFYQFIQYVR